VYMQASHLPEGANTSQAIARPKGNLTPLPQAVKEPCQQPHEERTCSTGKTTSSTRCRCWLAETGQPTAPRQAMKSDLNPCCNRESVPHPQSW
jgi:hypothetical protein